MKSLSDRSGVCFDLRSIDADAFMENYHHLKESNSRRVDFECTRLKQLPDGLEPDEFMGGGNSGYHRGGNNGGGYGGGANGYSGGHSSRHGGGGSFGGGQGDGNRRDDQDGSSRGAKGGRGFGALNKFSD